MTIDELERQKWLDALNLYQSIAFNEHPEMFRNMKTTGGNVASETLPVNLVPGGDMLKYTKDVTIPSLESIGLNPETYKDAAAEFILNNEGKDLSQKNPIDTDPGLEKRRLLRLLQGKPERRSI